MNEPIYLDNNATTAMDARVIKAMYKDLCTKPRNPSSIHSFGREARVLLTTARRTIASYLDVDNEEIVFTSSGTEANNLMIKGLYKKKGHIISSSLEHSSVLNTLKSIEDECDITYLTSKSGITKEQVKDAIRNDTHLIVLMAVNNETGVKSDIEAIAELATQYGITLLVDGVALLGKEKFKICKGVSAMSFSAHKFHGPKGIGFVYLKNTLDLNPIIRGGDQESRKRAGTENLSGILGLAKAVECLKEELPSRSVEMKRLRDEFEREILSKIEGIKVNGKGDRICNTSNLCFDKVDGETLFMALDLEGVAVGFGAACSTGMLQPSKVLMNMGLSYEDAQNSLRFSFSRMTTKTEVQRAIDIIEKNVKLQRASK